MKRTSITRQLSFLLMGILLAFQLHAQDGPITGKVYDVSTGEVLPGASVVIKGTTTGTTTSINGDYSINAKDGDVLVFSFVGYNAQEALVQGNRVIDMNLEMETIGMDEVVVIGYGKATKDDLTGSVAVVGADDFNKGAITSADQLLMGKTAGVQITNGGGAPGGETTIRIRGGSSLSSTNDPLIVIDNVPVATEGIDGMSNPLSSLNPDDIESFTVLKDASATAIYGSRASNGVIIITTKQGAKGKMQVNYSGKVSLSTPSGKIDVLSADEYRDLMTERYGDNAGAMALVGDADTDWQEEIFQNAFGTDHNLSVNGTVKEFMPYRASVGYTKDNGILRTSYLDRYTASLNLNPSFLDDHLTVALSVKANQNKNRFADRGAVNNAVTFAPTSPVMSGDTAFGGYFTWVNSAGAPLALAPRNPVAQLELREDLATVNRVIANAKLDYKMHFLPDLTATLNIGTDRSASEGKTDVPVIAPWDNQQGRFTDYTQSKKNDLLDFYVNYEKKIDAIDSKVNATAGYSYQYFYRTSFSETLKGNGDTLTRGIDRPTDYVILSYFGRLNYVLSGKYLLTATIRQDMTSRFSEQNRKGVFPSFAFAWNIHKEDFITSLNNISELKLRAGYGVTGQQYVDNNDYPYFGTYLESTETALYQFGNTYYYTLRPEG
ncbi:MAG: SusC/RagA family TonB-linked outer membrane protein, partial [Bacteroidales bacterium]|nr:SusC/RagA family TonB-linked outer membrane protein [Bacteroidales bacterium]